MQNLDFGMKRLAKQILGDAFDPNASFKEMCQAINAQGKDARKAFIAAYTKPIREAQEDSARTDWIRQVNEMDNVSFGVGMDPDIPLADRTFDNFRHRLDAPVVKEALDAVQSWVWGNPPRLLVLAGPVGTGKTHLATAAARTLFDRDEPVLYRTERNLIAELFAGMNNGKIDFLRQEFRCIPWLILDEMGGAAVKDFGESELDGLIDARWEAAGAIRTLITTNLTPDQLTERMRSRLQDAVYAKTVVIKASDYRREKR